MLNLSSTLKTNKAQSSNAKRSLLTASAILALTIPQLAMGQNVGGGGGEEEGGGYNGNISPKGEETAISPGGVDLRTGRFAYEVTDMSIGESSETGGLALSRIMPTNIVGGLRPFGNFSHGFDITILEQPINIFQPSRDPFYSDSVAPDYRMRVNFGSRTETFEAYKDQNYQQQSRTTYANLTFTGTQANAVYTMQAADGTIVKFRPITSNDCSSTWRCAYVSQITYPDETQLDFEYESTGNSNHQTKLRSVVSSRGYALLFEYIGNKQISKACLLNLAITPKPSNNNCPANAQATTSYTYNSNRKLATATNAAGETSSFSYTSAGMGFRKPGQSSDWLINFVTTEMNQSGEIEERVARQTLSDGRTYDYTYQQFAAPIGTGAGEPPEIPTIIEGSYIDNAGNGRTVKFGVHILPLQFGTAGVGSTGFVNPKNFGAEAYATTPGPEEIIDELGRTWKTDWCDADAMAGLPAGENHRCIVRPLPHSSTDPEGIKTEYVYDLLLKNLLQSTQKAKPGSGNSDIVISANFDTTNPKFATKPIQTTDANGNVSDFEYAAEHGGVTRTRGPAVNGVRPETRYSYVQRYARYKDASGNVIQSPNAMWLLDSERSCTNSNMNANGTCAGGASQLVVTSYDYGPTTGVNNLLLRGTAVTSGGKTLRTCYGYDDYGRRISETQPKGAGGSCS